MLKETTETADPFGNMLQKPWHLAKGAEPDGVIQLTCEEVRNHASYMKQPEHGRTSTTVEQKWSSFKTNDDL